MKLRAGTKVRIVVALDVEGLGEIEARRGWTIAKDTDHGIVGTQVKNEAKEMLSEAAKNSATLRDALKAAAKGGPAPGARR